MPVLISSLEINELAQKLAKMPFLRAKGYIRRLDQLARLDMFRVSVGANEWHTRYALPTKGLWITLVERKEIAGTSAQNGLERIRFDYLEARIEPIPDFARVVAPDHRGASGDSERLDI